jgi:hypothetical protein
MPAKSGSARAHLLICRRSASPSHHGDGTGPRAAYACGRFRRRVVSTRNHTRHSVSSIHTSTRLAVATSIALSHRVREVGASGSRFRLSSRNSTSISSQVRKSASLSSPRCSLEMLPTERIVVPRSLEYSVPDHPWRRPDRPALRERDDSRGNAPVTSHYRGRANRNICAQRQGDFVPIAALKTDR